MGSKNQQGEGERPRDPRDPKNNLKSDQKSPEDIYFEKEELERLETRADDACKALRSLVYQGLTIKRMPSDMKQRIAKVMGMYIPCLQNHGSRNQKPSTRAGRARNTFWLQAEQDVRHAIYGAPGKTTAQERTEMSRDWRLFFGVLTKLAQRQEDGARQDGDHERAECYRNLRGQLAKRAARTHIGDRIRWLLSEDAAY
jgi:hypothetical protein